MAFRLSTDRAAIVKKFLAGLALVAALLVAPATQASEAEAYVRDIAAKLEPLLQNGKVTPKSVDDFLQSNIAGELDMNRIAKYVLRNHWKAISGEDRKRFKSIFRLFIVENFKRQLVKYSNAEIRIIRSVEHKPEGVSVITRIRVPSKSPLNMNWRLFRENDELKIFDVSVQGISKLSATRAEYKSVLEQHGFEYLLEQICERLEKPNKAACTPG